MYGLDSSSMSLLAFGAVVVVGAVIMYLVSLFSMKETSFESVLEEQRKKKEKEDRERSQANKQKREQYKKKFNEKKKKTATIGNGKVEKVDSGVSPMHEVQIKETPQMESGEPAPVEPKKPKSKGAKKQQETIAAPKEGSPKPAHPILKHTLEKPKQETAAPPSQTPAVAKAEVQKQDAGRTRTVSFSDDVQEKQKPEVEQEKTKKKKKKEVQEVESEIVGQLRETALTDRDVQHILTMIKQKHGIDVGGGTKIKDLQHQLDSVKKHLTQSENNLQQYVSRCMVAENKIEQLKQDLMLEKTKVTSLEKAMQDADSKRKQEIAAVQSRQAAEIKQLKDHVERSRDYDEVCNAVKTLKTEKTYLVAEIQKNAAVVAEKNRLSADLQQLTQQLQESKRKCADLEAHQKQESNSTKLLEQVTTLQEDNEAKADSHRQLEQRLVRSEQLVAERDSKIKDVTKQNTDLAAQVQNLEQQIAQLNSQIIKIDKESKDKAASVTQSADDADQLNKLQGELEAVKKEKTAFKEDVDRLKKKNNDLRERSWKAMDTLSSLEKALPEKVAAAKADGDVRCARLEMAVKQSLSDAFPDVSISEEKFEVWVKAFASCASESSQTVQSTEDLPQLAEAESEVQKLRIKLEETSSESSNLRSKISNLESSVESIRQEKERLESNLQGNQEELSNAHSECEKYKNVLTSTEGVLCDLQTSVQVEEDAWRKKVQEAHKEASNAHQDAEDLRKTIEELKSEKSFLQSNVKEAEELKKSLEEATNEVSELKEQLESAKAGLTDGLQQTEDIESDDAIDVAENVPSPVPQVDKQQQCEDTPTKTVSCQSESPVQIQYLDACTETGAVMEQHQDEEGFLVIEQVDVDEDRLDKEKTLTKNLGQAATKLQSVLKQTQEQLNEEREKNAELENKITTENNEQKENADNGLTQQQVVEADNGTSV